MRGVQARWRGSVLTFTLYCALVVGGQELYMFFPGLEHHAGLGGGVPIVPAVQTVPDSKQQYVVPKAQALGSLVQVSLSLGP